MLILAISEVPGGEACILMEQADHPSNAQRCDAGDTRPDPDVWDDTPLVECQMAKSRKTGDKFRYISTVLVEVRKILEGRKLY